MPHVDASQSFHFSLPWTQRQQILLLPLSVIFSREDDVPPMNQQRRQDVKPDPTQIPLLLSLPIKTRRLVVRNCKVECRRHKEPQSKFGAKPCKCYADLLASYACEKLPNFGCWHKSFVVAKRRSMHGMMTKEPLLVNIPAISCAPFISES